MRNSLFLPVVESKVAFCATLGAILGKQAGDIAILYVIFNCCSCVVWHLILSFTLRVVQSNQNKDLLF